MVEVHQDVVAQLMTMCQLHCGRYTWQRRGGMADRKAGPSRESAVDAFHNLIHDTGPGGFRDHTERDVTLTTVPDDALAWYGTWGPCMTASNREPLVKDTACAHGVLWQRKAPRANFANLAPHIRTKSRKRL
jgi:hypothetical protein